MNNPNQLIFSVLVLACGAAFFAISLVNPNAMSPDEYGFWAYDLDAEIWALIYIMSPGLVIWGVAINGHWRWSPVLRIAGLSVLLCAFLFLAVSAAFSGGGVAVPVFGSLFFAPFCVILIVRNVMAMRLRP